MSKDEDRDQLPLFKKASEEIDWTLKLHGSYPETSKKATKHKKFKAKRKRKGL